MLSVNTLIKSNKNICSFYLNLLKSKIPVIVKNKIFLIFLFKICLPVSLNSGLA